jgi:hypothetical protein
MLVTKKLFVGRRPTKVPKYIFKIRPTLCNAPAYMNVNIKKYIMKKMTGICLLSCLLVAFGISCSKNNSSGGTTKSTLTLSNSSVKKGQPLIATANISQSSAFVKWSVNAPSASTYISSSGNKSVMLFSNSGNYTVTANYYLDSMASTPYDSSSSPILVTDSVYTDSVASCDAIKQVGINSGDQIVLTPISYSDTGLVVLAHTQQTYGTYYPSLGFPLVTDSSNGKYVLGFGEITEYPCNSATSVATPATGWVSFSQLTNGVHDVTIGFNNTVYTGTLTVTDTDCTFSWNYTSGITISPLTIQKQ